ncbi:MAG: exodeoxyribonuclease VII small subunit [Candidatus Saccharimonadales bacterium]
MTNAKKPIDYAALQAELDAIVTDLQRDDADVDTALKQYGRGLEIIELLETYLSSAENKVRELQAAFDRT